MPSNEIARRHGLLVIEDACQAHGAIWQGRKVGAIGDMGCFSFQASKNITGGEGGMIISNDEDWAERCWSVANVGRKRHGEWYGHITLASNYRLSEWAGAVLRVQLTRLDEQAEHRSASAAYLAEALSEVQGLTAASRRPARDPQRLSSLQDLVRARAVRRAHDAGVWRDAMRAEGVPVSTGYLEPLSETKVVVERRAYISERLGLPPVQDDCPVAREACQRGLWFFQSNLLGTRSDMDDVIRQRSRFSAPGASSDRRTEGDV